MNRGAPKWEIGITMTEERKAKMIKVTDDIIDRLYNYHKLSPLECGMALEFLQKSFDDTMRDLWREEAPQK
jgi:hypothetical protein